jgi:hypothetical protein
MTAAVQVLRTDENVNLPLVEGRADQGVEVRSVGGPCPADPIIVHHALTTENAAAGG